MTVNRGYDAAPVPVGKRLGVAWSCTTAAPCPYCGGTDHTGREHFQFVMSLSDPKDGDDDE